MTGVLVLFGGILLIGAIIAILDDLACRRDKQGSRPR